ncbi:MAG: hypothetical protein Ct9H90mP14_0630 [Methanobacteriota archaeon]|nr:MAG: hypothetical protein Ct9H90mP14_0630 [Euryarchaeota archaeon]
MVRTGHSFMKRELRSNPEAVMAGEMSGHFFLHDRWPGFDCSLYNAARLLEIVGRDSSPKDGGMISHRDSLTYLITLRQMKQKFR